MSTDASADTGENTPAVTDYEEMLDTIDVAIEEARRKIETGRVRNPEHEKVRCKQWKTLGYLINVRRQVANDRDLAELSERVEALEDQQEPGLKDHLLEQ